MHRTSAAPTTRAPVQLIVWSATLVAAGAVCALDLGAPLGVATGILYIPIASVSALWLRRRALLALGVLLSVLVVLGWAFSPPGGVPWMAAANRLATLLALWSVAVCRFVRHHPRTWAAGPPEGAP